MISKASQMHSTLGMFLREKALYMFFSLAISVLSRPMGSKYLIAFFSHHFFLSFITSPDGRGFDYNSGCTVNLIKFHCHKHCMINSSVAVKVTKVERLTSQLSSVVLSYVGLAEMSLNYQKADVKFSVCKF